MAITVQTEFLDVATVRVNAYIYDDNDALADPTAVTIDIFDPDGTKQVNGVAMTKTSKGTYYYYYHQGAGEAAMAEGRWRGVVKTADGTGASTIYSDKPFSFKVL